MTISDQTEFIKPADITADKPAPRMATRQLDEHSWVVIFSAGDEVLSGLTQWARDHLVGSGHLTAVGAWSSAVLGYYDFERKAYRTQAISQQVELLSLIGDFAVDHGRTVLHAHAVIGLPGWFDTRWPSAGGVRVAHHRSLRDDLIRHVAETARFRLGTGPDCSQPRRTAMTSRRHRIS